MTVKRQLKIEVLAAMTLCCVALCPEISAKNYYFSSNQGDDSNSGLTPQHPLKSLDMLSGVTLQAGDTIFLLRGSTFRGEIFIEEVEAPARMPLVVSSYGDITANQPLIDAAGYLSAIRLYNSSGVVVENIDITANGAASSEDHSALSEKISLSKTGTRCGVYYKTTRQGAYSNIRLSGVNIYDIFLNEEGFQRDGLDVNSANGTGGYGFGILFNCAEESASLSDIVIENCSVENVAHTGIRFVGKSNPFTVENAQIINTNVLRAGGPGIQMSGVKGGVLRGCVIDRSGSDDDSRKWKRGSGYWCWSSEDILVEHCQLTNSNGPADSSGAHIDFNCNNVVYQYNLSRNNAGGFVEILGNNYNCIYRYNVSINDGHRINGDTSGKAQEVAHQWGYTIWISNWSGTRKGPYNSYIYNNTIYVGEDNISRNTFAQTLEGIYIANNIFHIEGDAVAIRDKKEFAQSPQRGQTIFKNNLFLTGDSWAEDSTISDSEPLYGDAGFTNGGGCNIADYTPQNIELVKDRGVKIEELPTTKIPLTIDLHPKVDILGNPIKGGVDMGAIEIE